MKFVTRTIQLIIILIPVGLFVWLSNQFLVPSGEFIVRHSIEKSSPFIDGLLTDERVSDPYKDEQGNWIQKIFADPVFFFVHPHKVFDKAEFEVWFKNESLPIIELGALTTKNPERYTLKPLQNLIIDNSLWSKIQDGNTVLLQRKQQFSSLEDFYKNPPPRNEISTYQATIENPFRIDGYFPSQNLQTIDASLRGHHEMKTYIKNETMSFKFDYMDMNRDEGPDQLSIVVFNENNEPIADVMADDDGNVSTNAYPSELKTVELNIQSLPEGVYKIVMNAPRDIFFRKIFTTQQKIIFLNSLFIGDDVAYHESPQSTIFWTEAKRLSFQTRHAEGVQTVRVADESITIQEPYGYYTQEITKAGLSSVFVPLGDLEVISDSPLAFTRDQFFRPDPVRLLPHTNLDALKINYILASYSPPKEVGDWKVATVSFENSEMLLDKDSWKLSFSTPEIKDLNKEVYIKEINMKWIRRKMFWKDVLKMFKI